MARLYMIRHGKPSSAWGQDPDPDPGLDEAGQAQAKAAADALMALPADRRPTRVFSSPLRRCRETAQPLADEERGPWLRNAFQSQWSEVKGDIDYDDWRAAVGEALGELDGNTAVFSHFVAINAALACVTGEKMVLTFRPDHTSITVFAADDGRVSLVERGPE